MYISNKIFDSLEQMLPSAKKIQDWLTLSARKIALTGEPVTWVTPLGLVAKQAYFKDNPHHNRSLHTPFNYVNLRREDSGTPDVRKQCGGFAPNFVHSLDATHMLYTALGCAQRGLTFASVHDSFWTHACDVDVLNTVCREEFIRLHKQGLLDNLRDYFDRNYAGKRLRKPVDDRIEAYFDELPQRGELNIDQVIESKYFFS